ncbi:hypothetical protein C8R46DRAFT_1139740 [Mycena filopes]|nr:hypothetical protein C8R46DRAFT_1139740 [Mycena filopes]
MLRVLWMLGVRRLPLLLMVRARPRRHRARRRRSSRGRRARSSFVAALPIVLVPVLVVVRRVVVIAALHLFCLLGRGGLIDGLF